MLISNWNDSASVVTGIRTKSIDGMFASGSAQPAAASTAVYTVVTRHGCQLVRFSRKSYGFLINWLAYGRTRQSLRIFTIWKGGKFTCIFANFLVNFSKWRLLSLPWKVSRNIWRWSHPSVHCASTNCTTEHARVACITSQLHCAITNHATEHARGTCILRCLSLSGTLLVYPKRMAVGVKPRRLFFLSQNALLSMRRRLMHRNRWLLQKWCSVTSSPNTTCQPPLLAPSVAGALECSRIVPKAMKCRRTKITIKMTRCLAVEGTVPIIAQL